MTKCLWELSSHFGEQLPKLDETLAVHKEEVNDEPTQDPPTIKAPDTAEKDDEETRAEEDYPDPTYLADNDHKQMLPQYLLMKRAT